MRKISKIFIRANNLKDFFVINFDNMHLWLVIQLFIV